MTPRVSNPPAGQRPISVTLRIPGSTSNLGSGFDTLGLALRLHGFVRLTRLPTTSRPTLGRLPDEADPAAALTMVAEAARLFFRRTHQKSFGFLCDEWGAVPVARGLGASALLRLGVVAGLNELAGAGLERSDLLELVTELEGHPDNASPAIHGGFTVSGRVGHAVRCLAFRVSSRVKFVTLVPNFGIHTETARGLLPDSYARGNTMHALNRAALITASLAAGDYEALRGVFDDRIHQPQRAALIPELARVIHAGERAGAIGGFLSGSGSAIICLARQSADAVARAMQQQLPESTVKILTADNEGFKVVRSPRHHHP